MGLVVVLLAAFFLWPSRDKVEQADEYDVETLCHKYCSELWLKLDEVSHEGVKIDKGVFKEITKKYREEEGVEVMGIKSFKEGRILNIKFNSIVIQKNGYYFSFPIRGNGHLCKRMTIF